MQLPKLKFTFCRGEDWGPKPKTSQEKKDFMEKLDEQ